MTAPPTRGEREEERRKVVDALVNALSAMVAAEERIARTSYTEYRAGKDVFTNAIWRRADVEGFERVAEARRALKLAKDTPA